MAAQPSTGGPTIFDVNSGFALGPAGLHNIYEDGNGRPVPHETFSADEYSFYEGVIGRLKAEVEREFGLTSLWFTAPTFITRLVGNESWSPATMHDQYWMTHVDKNNTEHYDYSGLLYLSEHGADFEGGLLTFYDPDDEVTPVLEVAPRPGRIALFSSDVENPHAVNLGKPAVCSECRAYLLRQVTLPASTTRKPRVCAPHVDNTRLPRAPCAQLRADVG